MTINDVDYQVKFIKFPSNKVNEVVTMNDDGSYTIFIESSLSQSRRQNVLIHAIQHILDDDFCKYSADEIEKIAHKRSNTL